jgi:hypothetical protein
MSYELTPYERKAKAEIETWRSQPPSTLAKRLDQLTKPVDKVMAMVLERRVFQRALSGVMNVVLDGTGVTLSEERILNSYRKKGYELDRFEDIRTTVSLEHMDRQAMKLAKRYRTALATEGGGAGLAATFPPAAVPALAADVIAVTTAGTRAATHYAMTYGFRVESPPERALALSVLNGATSADIAAKEAALAEVARIAKMVAQKKTWEQLEKRAVVRAIKEAAETLTKRLTKAKLGQIIMVVGAFVAAGYNAWYMNRVGEWGYYTYRELHIKEKERLRAEHEAQSKPDADDAEPIVDADVVDESDDGTDGEPGREDDDELGGEDERAA